MGGSNYEGNYVSPRIFVHFVVVVTVTNMTIAIKTTDVIVTDDTSTNSTFSHHFRLPPPANIPKNDIKKTFMHMNTS